MASSQVRLSRDEARKNKEIEEMRKAGTLMPEVDEDGNMINPHIPQYMSQASRALLSFVSLSFVVSDAGALVSECHGGFGAQASEEQ